MVSYEPKYLVMVQPKDADGVDHNKMYAMTPKGNMFQVEYGRVGAAHTTKMYGREKWESLYNEKIRKGYVDMTQYHAQTAVQTAASGGKIGNKTYAPIDDATISAMIDKLLSWANKTVSENYTVSVDEVTKEAVEEAQRILDSLANNLNIQTWEFNQKLNRLYTVIPRRIADVGASLAKDSNDYDRIIAREQSMLDAISVKAMSSRKVVSKKAAADGETVLDANGLEVRTCSPEEIEQVKSRLDPDTRAKFVNAWHVVNKETREKFDEYCKANKIGKRGIKYYYHGSRNGNYWNIVVQGLKLHPTQRVTRAGAMFGHGLYFAPKAAKSMGYTSLAGSFWTNRLGDKANSRSAMLLVFKVAMGKSKDLYAFDSTVAGWNEADAKRAGVNSVFAHAGKDLRNDEAIVYNESACTISYIIELKA